ncbi:Mur ligase [Polychytrium aggregatum]|uniref:Mur ligase n=1 Tax=Polychytrium aggregatum TaxID=110093 RepID=UPI0022FE72ED|nr:Mur ligase [Polychytrium aggregatum]KAI9206049.1 Mur ligase [Polychytrium aggregatum]
MSIELGLAKITTLLAALGNPHEKLKIVHVGGTNGKGSVCAYISNTLTCAGYKTGRFNSPHLVAPNDSIRINEQAISQEVYVQARAAVTQINAKEGVQASLFEILTATAFCLFAQEAVQVAVIEVGLGGRLDATNVCSSPLVCVFTSIGLDHVDLLGDTHAKIAREKAGIMRSGVPVVVGHQANSDAKLVLVEQATALGCPLELAQPLIKIQDSDDTQLVSARFAGANIEFQLPLVGDFQLENSAIALKALEFLQHPRAGFALSPEAVIQGMSTVRWPGRLEWITAPAVGRMVIDGAHNAPAAIELRRFIDNYHRRHPLAPAATTFIFAMTRGKDMASVLSHLLRANDRLVAVPFSQPEDMPWIHPTLPADIVALVEERFASVECEAAADLDSAFQTAGTPASQGLVVLCGSLYLVADVYRHLSLPL